MKRFFTLLLALTLLLGAVPASAAYTQRQFSDALVDYIKNGEGFRSEPYSDGTGWYIGYGCACDPADYPNGITEEGAEALLREKMQRFADAVNSFLQRYEIEVTQGQFDAMCALSYSVGTAWLKAENRLPSILIDGLEKHGAQEIASAFGAWCHVGGSVSEALLKRRIMEVKMFLDEDYSATADGWNWLILDAAGGENEWSDVALYRAGEAYGSLPAATRSGYTFGGWMSADNQILSEDTVAAQNLRVSAVWKDAEEEKESGETAAVTPPEYSGGEIFPDVKAEDWFFNYVGVLAEAGVVDGYDDGLFRPENSVTWAEGLKLILRSAGFPEQSPGKDEHWAAGYLKYAENHGFVGSGSVSNLDGAMTRDEIADLCAKALSLDAPAGSSPFADSARKSVVALYEAGIVEGSIENGQRLYKGADKIRRSEICAVLTRVLDYVEANFVFAGTVRVPIDFTLRMNDYDTAAFGKINGRVTYDDGVTRVRYGIDVSAHQGEIDWKKVAADGIDFAIIRCGYRGYSAGSLNTDDYFEANIRGAIAAGLDVGVYFFSQALNVEEALEEAQYTLDLIRGYDLSFPVVFDWEQITYSGSRTRTFDGKTVTDCTIAFCDAIAAAGYTPMTYFNKTMAYTKLDMHRLQCYNGWLAWYHDVPDYIYDYQMWQYGSSGSVKGISGRVDMNIAFRDFAA